MNPINKLRFFERTETFDTGLITIPDGLKFMGTRKVLTLQQWWEAPDAFDMITGRPAGEWRDVPTETEE